MPIFSPAFIWKLKSLKTNARLFEYLKLTFLNIISPHDGQCLGGCWFKSLFSDGSDGIFLYSMMRSTDVISYSISAESRVPHWPIPIKLIQCSNAIPKISLDAVCMSGYTKLIINIIKNRIDFFLPLPRYKTKVKEQTPMYTKHVPSTQAENAREVIDFRYVTAVLKSKCS